MRVRGAHRMVKRGGRVLLKQGGMVKIINYMGINFQGLATVGGHYDDVSA